MPGFASLMGEIENGSSNNNAGIGGRPVDPSTGRSHKELERIIAAQPSAPRCREPQLELQHNPNNLYQGTALQSSSGQEASTSRTSRTSRNTPAVPNTTAPSAPRSV
jgi:hypothetical protein